jgi:hypothetical protein
LSTDDNDAQIEEYLDKLMELLDSKRTEVSDLWWKDETISLDSYRFVNCRFENCTLTYRFPDFELIGCALVETDVISERKHRLTTEEVEKG